MTVKAIVRPSTPKGFRAIDGRSSLSGRPRHPAQPLFAVQPLKAQISGAARGVAYEVAQLCFKQKCENCHSLAGQGGQVLDLRMIADRITSEKTTVRILTGGINAPTFGAIHNLGNDVLVGIPGIAKCQFKHTAGAGNRSEISMRAHS